MRVILHQKGERTYLQIGDNVANCEQSAPEGNIIHKIKLFQVRTRLTVKIPDRISADVVIETSAIRSAEENHICYPYSLFYAKSYSCEIFSQFSIFTEVTAGQITHL